jgi:hypothetical protein
MFDPPTQRYPKKWKEMSLDFKLMFVYHGSMMVLFIAGQNLSVSQEILLTSFLVVVLVAISLRHRRLTNWRWPPVRPSNVFWALFGAVAIAFFLFSATPLFPPSDHRILPWYLAGLGIGVFGILTSLRVVDASEADFLSHCRIIDQYGREFERPSELPQPKESEPNWKKMIRGIYTVVFLLLWTVGVASFFFFGTAFRSGSPIPTATQAEPLTDHGKTVYVTRAEKQRINYFQLASGVGIPIILVSAVVLHFLVGVKLFPNAPTLSEYWAKRNRPTSNPPTAKPL